MESKPFYLSKTIWTNFILGVVVIAVPKLADVFTVDSLAIMFTVVNVFLRAITKSKLEIR